jgi:hypothetical protein
MDQEILAQIAKLPAAQGRKKALSFVAVLADDLKQLEAETARKLKPLQAKVNKFDQIRKLVAEQADLLEHARTRNDDIEHAILKLLDLADKKRSSDDDF